LAILVAGVESEFRCLWLAEDVGDLEARVDGLAEIEEILVCRVAFCVGVVDKPVVTKDVKVDVGVLLAAV